MANKKISDLTAETVARACIYEIEVPGVGSFKVTANANYGLAQLNATGKIPATILDLTAYAPLAGAVFTGTVSFAGAVTSAGTVTPSTGVWNLASATSVSVPTLAAVATGQGAANADWVRAQNYITNGYLGINYFGDGSDGNIALDGTTTFNAFSALSAGVYTLSRDVYFADCTITSTAKIATNGFRVFVAGTLDLSASQSGAIVYRNGGNGGSTAGQTAGTNSPFGGSGGTIMSGTANGGNGASGAAGNGGTGLSGTAISSGYSGGSGGAGGAGGLGSGGTAGVGGAGVSAAASRFVFKFIDIDFRRFAQGSASLTTINGGAGGGGGGAGGGSTSLNAGGGGAGGGGAGIVFIAARRLVRGSISNVIHANAGNGGNGGAAQAASNAGGGGGGAGGGGGLCYIIVGVVSGTGPMTVSANGGNGGNGGTHVGTGIDGSGGAGGESGICILFNFGAGTVTSASYVAGGAAAGAGNTTGSIGGIASLSL